jgi:hypothetical protein
MVHRYSDINGYPGFTLDGWATAFSIRLVISQVPQSLLWMRVLHHFNNYKSTVGTEAAFFFHPVINAFPNGGLK